MMIIPAKLTRLATLSILLGFTYATNGVNAADYRAVQQLLDTSKTGIGQSITYPAGQAKIASLILTLAPGEKTGVHLHPVPTYGYVLQGELTVDYGKAGIKTFKKGTAFMEAQLYWHNGMNKGTTPVRVLLVYMGAADVPYVIRPPAAK